MLQVIPTQSEVMQIIKDKEVVTGRPGRYFTSRHKNGAFATVKLTIENDMLIVDGRELLDMSKVEILALGDRPIEN